MGNGEEGGSLLEVLKREAVDGAPQRAPHGGDDDGVERSEAEIED